MCVCMCVYVCVRTEVSLCVKTPAARTKGNVMLWRIYNELPRSVLEPQRKVIKCVNSLETD